MVWSQYVYEASTGFEHDASDDDDFIDDTPLNIEDWEVEYSDELRYMWDMINTLMYDAHINHTGKFCDFVEFVSWNTTPIRNVSHGNTKKKLGGTKRGSHIWRNLRRCINENGLHEYMMRGATFYHFVDFAKNFMSIY